MLSAFKEFVATPNFTELVIIYPGRFQPAHKNHFAVYNSIQQHFTAAYVYISTTDSTGPDSPFSFYERKIMLEAAGVPSEFIIKCTNPYIADEIKSKHIIDKTKFIFAVGEKDMLPPSPRFKVGLKRDGTPTYMQISQPANILDITQQDISVMHTADTHSYVSIASTRNFTLSIGSNSIKITGATQIRNLYRESSTETRKSIIKQLYNNFDPHIYKIFNSKLLK